jgi:hypothetical protein
MIIAELLYKRLSEASRLRLLIALNAEARGEQYDENEIWVKIAQAVRHQADNSAEERSQALAARS